MENIQLGENEYTETVRHLLDQGEYIYQDNQILQEKLKSKLGSFEQN